MITPELSEIISEAIESRLIDVHTSIPGRIQSYDPVKQIADVELQIKRTLPRADGTYTTEALPVLKDVRVAFPKGGGFVLTFPLAAGDPGEVFFTENSIDQWLSKGGVTTPGDVGRFTLSGAVFHAGLCPNAENIADDISSDLVLGKEGGAQVRGKSATVEVTSGGASSAADFVALAAKLDQWIAALDTVLRTWVVAPTDGGAALKAAYIAAVSTAPASNASSNLKAD